MDIQTLFFITGAIFFFTGSVLLIFSLMFIIYVARKAYTIEKEVEARVMAFEDGIKDFKNSFSSSLFSGISFIAKILKNR